MFDRIEAFPQFFPLGNNLFYDVGPAVASQVIIGFHR
jgi:hypothetical protein